MSCNIIFIILYKSLLCVNYYLLKFKKENIIKLYTVFFKLTQSINYLLYIYMYNMWLPNIKPDNVQVREKNFILIYIQ